MKKLFRKAATVLGSALMVGATVGMAAAAAYPAPFVTGGAADVAIVHGSNAAISDVVGAANIMSNLATELAAQTASGGTTTTATVTGGDSVDLSTSSQKVYWNSTMNAAKTSITKSEMPTMLADGSITDDSGTAYSYVQSIKLGNRKVDYSTSGNDFDDPELIIDAGYTATSPLYNYSLTMNKDINVTHSDVQGNEISILGKSFTIGASSQVDTSTKVLYLYGTGESITLNEGEETTITINDEEHTIKIVGISSAEAVSVSVDGGTVREVSEGASSKVGGLEVYVKTSFYSAKETSSNYATLNIGSEKLKLQNGQTVYEGSDEDPIQNTKVTIGHSGGKMSSITLSIAIQDTTADYIKAGESFTDPVFGGMKVSFAGVTPALDADSRETITVDTDNSRNARVAFQSALADESKTFTFLHDQDTSESTVTPFMADTGNKTLRVEENAIVMINEYMMINSGDYGRIIKLTSVPTGALTANSKIQFEDALTGESLFSGGGLTIGIDGNATTNIDGQPYYFRATNLSSNSYVQVTWGAGATYANAGTQTTLFPRIKLKNGGWLSILKPVTVSNATKYVLPGVETLTTYESGAYLGFSNNTNAQTPTKVFGNVNYTMSVGSNQTSGTLWGIDTNNDGTIDCNFNATYGGAILFQEEKKTSESGNSDNGDVICVAADTSGSTTPVEISISTPKVTNLWSSLQTWTSDSYQQSAVTRYGTYIKYNSQDNDKVEIIYPDEQMFADVLFVEEGATVTAGTSTSGGEAEELGSVTVEDTDAASVSGKNLVVVGGSCINSVAADLLGEAACGAAFTDLTGVSAGGYLIQSFEKDGAVALLVAGYEAADTTKAVTYLTNNGAEVDTTAGKKYTGTTATEATEVTVEETTTDEDADADADAE